jgi:hypothetical protein
MRRLLAAALVASAAFAVPAAHAGCDPETGECNPSDCIVWRPNAATAVQRAQQGDVAGAALGLLPPSCP